MDNVEMDDAFENKSLLGEELHSSDSRRRRVETNAFNEILSLSNVSPQWISREAFIKDAFISMINTILSDMGRHSQVFQGMKIIPTGSHSDGTKLNAPDEFDFMVELESITDYLKQKTDQFKIVVDERNKMHFQFNEGCCHSIEVMFPGLGRDELSCSKPDILCNIDGLSELPDMKTWERKFYRGSFTMKDGPQWEHRIVLAFKNLFKSTAEDLSDSENIFKKGTGTLHFGGVVADTDPDPTMQLWTRWVDNSSDNLEDLIITSDITPCVNIEITDDVLKANDVNLKAVSYVSNLVTEPITFKLTLKRTTGLFRYGWELTFSHIETSFISNLDRCDVHRKCIRILKWLKSMGEFRQDLSIEYRHFVDLNTTTGRIEPYTSYMAKTVVLRHMQTCAPGERNLDSCCMYCLRLIRDMVAGLPNFSTNVFQSCCKMDQISRGERRKQSIEIKIY